MELESAIKDNLKYQKKYKKERYTKPVLFNLIESFIISNQLVCYGGMAINAYLPSEKQFYDETDIPDYDCFSPNPIKDVIELSNILANNKMENVEVKSAMFPGTYKIFVNFIPIVDITTLDPDVFYNIHKKSIKINNILYAPPNYLRISLYQELSRPFGDISRWGKIYNRLELLNQTHPLFIQNCSISEKDVPETDEYTKINKNIINTIKKNNWVTFGDFGLDFYLPYFPKKYQTMERTIHTPFILVDSFEDVKLKLKFKYTIEYFSYHFVNSFYQISYKGNPVLYIFITNSCQSYNEIKGFRVATIDTILSIYYALSFVEAKFIDNHKILSYCYLLHNINSKEGVTRRFHMPCIGNQQTVEDIRKERDVKFRIYKKTKSKKLYNQYFFQYKPHIKFNKTKHKKY